MATSLKESDALVLYRSGDTSSPYPGSFHFTLGDLGEFMTEEGFTVCYITDNVSTLPLVSVGSLVYDISPGYKGTNSPLNILRRWNGFNWEAIAASEHLNTDFHAFTDTIFPASQDAQDARTKDIEDEQATQNARLDDHDSDLNSQDARISALEASSSYGVYINPGVYPSPKAQPGDGTYHLVDTLSNKVVDYEDLRSTDPTVLTGRIYFHLNDQNDNTPDVDAVGADDVIRINGPNSIGATLKIINKINSGLDPSVFGYEVNLIEKYGDVVSDVEVTIQFLPAFDPSNYVQVSVYEAGIKDLDDRKLDAPYTTPYGDSIPANNPTTGLPWQYGEQFFLTATVELMVWANVNGQDGWWPTFDQKQLEDEVGVELETKVSKSGTSMLEDNFALKNLKADGNRKSLITLVNPPDGDTSGKRLRLQWLTEPGGRGDAATKAYVDDTIANQPPGFNPGDRIAASSSNDTEVGGFYMTSSGSLYFKIS